MVVSVVRTRLPYSNTSFLLSYLELLSPGATWEAKFLETLVLQCDADLPGVCSYLVMRVSVGKDLVVGRGVWEVVFSQDAVGTPNAALIRKSLHTSGCKKPVSFNIIWVTFPVVKCLLDFLKKHLLGSNPHLKNMKQLMHATGPKTWQSSLTGSVDN